MIKIRKGLNLPIEGEPAQRIDQAAPAKHVAILGEDYVGMKPTMHINEGDTVRAGQPLFSDKKNPGVVYTAPAAGTISAVNRGAKRKLLSVVIEVSGNEQIELPSFKAEQLIELERQTIVDNMVKSGIWTALRNRPYSKIPAIDSTTDAIFVTAMDTNPLAADPQQIIESSQAEFNFGLVVLSRLTGDKVYVCAQDGKVPQSVALENVEYPTFTGIHPAGLVGTHMHFVYPVGKTRNAWHIGYQDVIALGRQFHDGVIDTTRVIALGGPLVQNPRLLRTRIGASFDEILENELVDADYRIISGSVFNGFSAKGPRAYLGRYHNQISVLQEGREKEFFGWIHPGKDKFSVTRAFISHLLPKRKIAMTTSTGGSERAIMPIGSYERVMPLDILATQLLRALVTDDTDTAQQLGCLELDEEDLALCTYACPGKYEYGPILREALEKIEKEG